MNFKNGEFTTKSLLNTTGLTEREQQIYNYYLEKFTKIATSTFKGDFSDDRINSNIIEKYLWYYGHCCIWKSPDYGIIVSKCAITGYDINGIPNKWQPQYENGTPLSNVELNKENSVMFQDSIIYDLNRIHSLWVLYDIVETHSIIKQQTLNQRTPLLAVAGSQSIKEKIKSSIVNIYKGVQAMFLDSDLTENIKVLDLNAPFNVDILKQCITMYENEVLQFLGTDVNDAFPKKERLIVSEQEGNDEELNYNLASCLNARNESCKNLKKVFGIDGSYSVQGFVRPVMKVNIEGAANDRQTQTI